MSWLPWIEVFESDLEKADYTVLEGWTLSIGWGPWALSFTFSRAPKGDE